jgi:Ca-activated chloride channel homolog
MFRFEYPYLFHLYWALPILLLLLLLYRRWRRRAIGRIGDPELVSQMMPQLSNAGFWLRQGLLLTGLALLILSAANPQRGKKQQQVEQMSADVFIALDISESMYCTDIAPNRLERAQVFARKLVSALHGQRIGLIFFAGNAFLQMPLSTDYEAATLFLRAAHPDMVSEPGTALSAAIALARESFDPDPGAGRALVLITDGEDHDASAVQEAQAAWDDGMLLFAVAAGTPDGGPIPLGGQRFKIDEDGNTVHTKMNEKLLRDLAAAGHSSQIFHVSQGDAAVSALKQEINSLEKRAVEVRSYRVFESYFQWPLGLALLLITLSVGLGLKAPKRQTL